MSLIENYSCNSLSRCIRAIGSKYFSNYRYRPRFQRLGVAGSTGGEPRLGSRCRTLLRSCIINDPRTGHDRGDASFTIEASPRGRSPRSPPAEKAIAPALMWSEAVSVLLEMQWRKAISPGWHRLPWFD